MKKEIINYIILLFIVTIINVIMGTYGLVGFICGVLYTLIRLLFERSK